MRLPDTVPLVHLPGGVQECCPKGQSTFRVPAELLPHWQPVPFGTTRWRQVHFGRKNAVEGANSGVKTQFINIDGNYWQVFGLEKVMVLLTFGLAGYNLDRLRRWQIDLSIAADKKRAEQRRRRSEAQRKAKARRAA